MFKELVFDKIGNWTSIYYIVEDDGTRHQIFIQNFSDLVEEIIKIFKDNNVEMNIALFLIHCADNNHLHSQEVIFNYIKKHYPQYVSGINKYLIVK